MARYAKDSDGNFKLIADNGNIFEDHITHTVKNKLGLLDAFVSAARRSKPNDNTFEAYLNERAQKLNESINQYAWYWKIATFLRKNSFLINFKGLHVVNTKPGYINRDNADWLKVPIYYKKIYTTKPPYFDNILPKEKEDNSEVYALKFKPRKISKKDTKEKRLLEETASYDNYYQIIKNTIKEILTTGHKIAVLDIPSSRAHTETVLDQIIHEISNSNIINASDMLVRFKNKETSHSGTGIKNRSIKDNINTLKLSFSNTSKKLINTAEAFIILDDVTTTGSSFIAIDKFIRNYENKGVLPKIPIINVAYAQVVDNFYSGMSRTNYMFSNQSKPIKGVIFDLDNTLLNTNSLIDKYGTNQDFHSIKDIFDNNKISMQLVKIIKKLLKNNIMISYVSNRGYRFLNRDMFNAMIGYVDNNKKAENQLLMPDDMYYNKGALHNFFKSSSYVMSSTVDVKDDDSYSRCAKPGPYWITQAIKRMKLSASDRIIGIGNQESDIIAYEQADIEPILVNWFNKSLINPYNIIKGDKILYKNPVPLIDYNKDKVTKFDTINSFDKWLNSQLNSNTIGSDLNLPF